LWGALGASLARSLPAVSAGAILLSGVALGSTLVPAVAMRLGGLAATDIDGLAESVARTDEWIVGLHGGAALTAGVAATVAALGRNVWVDALAASCACALVLRS